MVAQLLNQLYTGINKTTQELQSDDHGSSHPVASLRIILSVLNNPLLAAMLYNPSAHGQIAPLNAKITALIENAKAALTKSHGARIREIEELELSPSMQYTAITDLKKDAQHQYERKLKRLNRLWTAKLGKPSPH